ncbi:MAG: reverse transcriptase (RNA-dependent DNA polymerase) [Bacillota bacterium]|nr:MAG: reverse transcriptase (RNA-dependent DNA polymerase) [Bacillota bacterium]
MTSSRKEQGQQKTLSRGSLQEEVVNTQGTVRAQSSYPAQVRSDTCGTEYTLLDEMLKLDNMMAALKRVEQNKGAAGVDEVDVKSLRPYLKEHWFRIREELLEGTYKPQPVRRVEIPKSDGGVRLLGIPTLVDRLIQQGLAQVLTPIFDPNFSNSSYGFRPNRSTHQAVKQAKQYIEDGYRHVVDLDLEKFFDRVNHDILMARVTRKVKDKRVLKLIRAYLNAGVMANGVCVRSEQGVPQGGPLSPILSNIILDDLDKELERRGHRFVRYADDCNIYVKTVRAGQRVMEGVKRFVEDELKLKVNEQKSAVDRPWKRKFLGFSFTPERKTRTRIAPKARAKFEDKVRELTSRSRSMSMAKRIDQLNVYLRGWMGYFRLADTRSVIESLDQWTRRRLRMCYLKQWKKPKSVYRNLVKLGLSADFARRISGSGKGYWRLSNTPQMNKALGLAFWANQGLLSLVHLYDKHRSVS